MSVENNHPQISIVTPSFNQAPFLEECIDSILSQNYPNLEYIIMDGGSNDGSVEIIKKYSKYLAYWQSQLDGGHYNALNQGFCRAKGEIFGWLNSDDKMHSGSLKIIGGVFSNYKNVDWITGRPTAWDENGFLSYISEDVPNWSLDKCLNRLPGDSFIQQESTYWRRSLWEKAGARLAVEFQYAADFELWIRFFRYSNLCSVDALIGGFRYHEGQKTSKFMHLYNHEVAQIICSKLEDTAVNFSFNQESIQTTISSEIVSRLNMNDCCNVIIATSISPSNIEIQQAAINSWLQLGFKVISVNNAEEIAEMYKKFPSVLFVKATKNAFSEIGRPLIYVDDILSVLHVASAEICGIVNSDIFLEGDSGFIDYVAEHAKDGLLFGSRIDVDSMNDLDGQKFIYGFDFFFFNKRFAKLLPESGFCLGVPWWDYWLPLVMIIKSVPCKEMISPVAFHVKHDTNWASDLFLDYGKKFSDNISQFSENSSFNFHISTDSTPEKITCFSFDVLEHILNKSEKIVYPIVYPRAIGGNTRIEVGKSQYLTMRELILVHHRRVWELKEQIKIIDAELEQLHSSLFWRITKSLRWLGNMVRKLED